ncbi:MAG: hypothetical protein NT169_17535 [Chloroflexi bacterium]|nr:hypothetical protein [Chloroflexota bacterium]
MRNFNPLKSISITYGTGGVTPPLLSRRRWQIIAGLLYVAIGMASRLHAYNQPDATWYVYACQRILDGSLDIWSRLDELWAAPPLGMALTYPPLVPLLLTPWVAVGQALGLPESGLHVLIGLPMLLGDVALAYLIAATTGAWIASPAVPGTDRRESGWQLVIFLLCLLTFVVPFSSAYMGHHETFVVLLILLAVRANNFTASGIFWGLAIAAKQTAAFAYVPFVLLLLKGAWQERRPAPGELIRFVLLSVGIPVAFILPFWLAHPESARYALLTVESRRELYGLNIPRLLDGLARRLAPGSAAAIHALLVQASSPFFLLLIATTSIVFALRQRRSGRSPTGPDAPLWAAMGATFAAYVVFGKWNDTHYQLMPLMFLLMLDLVERPAFPYVYVLFTFAATQFYVLAEPVSGYWRFLLYVGLLAYFLAKAWMRPGPGT